MKDVIETLLELYNHDARILREKIRSESYPELMSDVDRLDRLMQVIFHLALLADVSIHSFPNALISTLYLDE